MTFFLFLASVAVLEYILTREKHATRPGNTKKFPLPPNLAKQPAADSSLASLANALEQFGTPPDVSTPQHQEAVHKPGTDRV